MPPPRPPIARATQAPAYVMPLAVGTAGVLLLLSSALVGLAMRERVQVGALERLRREEDLLASAAHQLVGTLNARHSCLLGLALGQWEVEGAACASRTAVAALKEGEVMATPVRLLAWQPGVNGQAAELELALVAGPGRTARRGRFGARLEGIPPQAIGLRARFRAGGSQ